MARTIDAMKAEIEEGTITSAQLADLRGKELAARYRVGRTTAVEARKAALSEIAAN